MAWISHLDTLRLLDRALRRAGLPVSFSGGFHPMPRLRVALPLPLGVEGLEEWLDLDLAEPLAAEQVRDRLQRELPAGLRLRSVAEVPVAGPSLSRELRAAHWRFSLGPGAAEDDAAPWPTAATWANGLETLERSERWIWHDHDKKGRPRQRDCRPALRQVRLLHHDWQSPQVEMALETSLDGQGFGLRPEHLRGWLSEHLGQPLRLGWMRREALLLQPPAPGMECQTASLSTC
jgi:radical SAM-linked protein